MEILRNVNCPLDCNVICDGIYHFRIVLYIFYISHDCETELFLYTMIYL